MENQTTVSREKTESHCRCPFCNETQEMPFPFCQACGAELHYCPECGQPLPQDADTCSYCSGED